MGDARYHEQGPGDLVPGRGSGLIELLESRDGQLTILELVDGTTLRSFNIAYGRDYGEEREHFTLNISPSIDGEVVEFLSSGDVKAAVDPATTNVLYRRLES
ncbi:hypothetical protein [Brevundimonas sp.]|uniref:hypothetical protein n=1 Tax=Brevundimonas sp. TaxID=1871086 RepID=UPI002D7297BC|nr:hypothetical protein [Brevundimonas sp.]HYC73247.1 hypothetical protein [Brevundimonas sp.]